MARQIVNKSIKVNGIDIFYAHIHIIEGGHWALETNFGEVLDLIDNFLS